MMNPLGQLHIEMECQEKTKRIGALGGDPHRSAVNSILSPLRCRRLLVQAAGRERQRGWRGSGGSPRIV